MDRIYRSQVPERGRARHRFVSLSRAAARLCGWHAEGAGATLPCRPVLHVGADKKIQPDPDGHCLPPSHRGPRALGRPGRPSALRLPQPPADAPSACAPRPARRYRLSRSQRAPGLRLGGVGGAARVAGQAERVDSPPLPNAARSQPAHRASHRAHPPAAPASVWPTNLLSPSRGICATGVSSPPGERPAATAAPRHPRLTPRRDA